MRVRRGLGLVAFGYASAHAAVFIGLDYGFDLQTIASDGLATKPYVILGASALAVLTALALTSTRSAMRRLGRGWRRLHRGVYAAAILVLMHITWAAKVGLWQTWPWVLALGLLLALRAPLVSRAVRGRAPSFGQRTGPRGRAAAPTAGEK